MKVEFYGLPGSGKTTISKALGERDTKFVYLHTSPRREIIKYFPMFFIHHPLDTIFWLKEILRECIRLHFRSLFRYKLHLFFISVVQYQKACNNKGAISLIDEGLYQRILSFYETEKSRKEIERCIAHIPNPDVLVIANNKETEFYRFLRSPHRHESPRLRLGQQYFENWMEIVRYNDEIIKSVLKSTQKNVIVCDGAEGLRNCIDKIEKEV